MRINELSSFCEALAAIKRAAAYTTGDMHSVLRSCRENQLIGRMSLEGDPVEAWIHAVKHFFSDVDDITAASEFILGYGRNDLVLRESDGKQAESGRSRGSDKRQALYRSGFVLQFCDRAFADMNGSGRKIKLWKLI